MRAVRTLCTTIGTWTPPARDAVLAAPITVIVVMVTVRNVTEHDALRLSPLPPGVTLALVLVALVGAAGALVLRRRAPAAALAIAVAARLVEVWLMPNQNAAWLSISIGLYSCGAYLSRRQAAMCWLLTWGAFAFSGFASDEMAGAGGHSPGRAVLLGTLVNDTLVFGLITLLGAYVQTRRAYRAELVARAERLERDRERHVTDAITDERGRIARELHDVVAHHLSGMVVQAGAAERLIDTDPERSRALMSEIRSSGRETLMSMRRLIGMLRAADDSDAISPQPRLHQLSEIVATANAAGVPVQVAVEGEPRPLPDNVDLAACRIVQEALTNVRKHAPGSVARAYVRYRPRNVEIEVVDDGRSTAAANGPRSSEPSGGVGLIGMRERTAVFGGDFSAGPRAQGGWRVRALLPLRDMGTGSAESDHRNQRD